jgi:hypothetical protein
MLAGCAATKPVAQTPAQSAAVSIEHSDDDAGALRAAGIDREALRCNRLRHWGSYIKPDSKVGALDLYAAVAPSLGPIDEGARQVLSKKLESLLFWRMVRAVIVEGNGNNFGALTLRGRTFVDDKGVERPVVVFRTGFTPHPDQADSCFQSLLDAGGVKHVVNLFDGDIPAEDLVAAESKAAVAHNASYHFATDGKDGADSYGPWRDTLRKSWDDVEKRNEAMKSVARLVREQILAPGGAAPRGNIHVHCGGGMHRTGMIVGVVERCINHEPPEAVEAHYKFHVGWQDAQHPGGFEEGNLRFIQSFDCSLLDPPQ